jgi:hypothetical protein
MPWLIGIDEAGYGPNLGPFVMTSVACRVPEALAGADLWEVLRAAVRRRTDPGDGRLLIEDSKVVYSPTRGLRDLEAGVLATVFPRSEAGLAPVGGRLGRLCPDSLAGLRAEPWYTGRSPLPLAADPEVCRAAADRFGEVSAAQCVFWGVPRSVVICPARFNGLLERWGSKGAVLGHALGELLMYGRALDAPCEPVYFCVDKHGGRNTYAALVQNALPDGMVVAHEEGHERSVYSVLGCGRELRLTFRPRADAAHFCVALASMVSKYVREVLMREFNHFWAGQVPGLKATAGYPGDADRFFEAIRPAAARLNIPEAALWRAR